MKKRVLLLVLVSILLLAAGCGSLSAVKEAKALIDDYYDAFTDEDFDDIIDMFHQSLIEDIGSEEIAQQALANRYDYYGEIDDYSYTGTSFETAGGQTEIVLSLEVTYESGDKLTEEFVLLKENEDLTIIGIDLK